MPDVESQHIRSVEYHNGVLTVKFHQGGSYQYHGVSVEIFKKFLLAPSKSQFFREHVKGQYHYGKVNA